MEDKYLIGKNDIIDAFKKYNQDCLDHPENYKEKFDTSDECAVGQAEILMSFMKLNKIEEEPTKTNKMKTTDEKARDYTSRLCNQTGKFTIHEVETAYVTGAIEASGVFDKSNLSFGRALEALKQGKRVARQGWNGKGMFIFMRPADELNIDFVIDKVKSLPQSVKDYYLQDLINERGERVPADDNDTIKFSAYICMKAVDGSIVNGWLASQTDMLSEDWEILD